MPGLQRFEAARGIATPDGSAVPYQRIAELTFEDMDALQAGLGSDEGQAAINDVPKFATGGVTNLFRRDRLTFARSAKGGPVPALAQCDSKRTTAVTLAVRPTQ